MVQNAGCGAEASQPLSSAERRASRNVFGYDPTPDFIKFDPEYRQKHARHVAQLRELQLELARQTANGRPTPCSRQIFLEVRWLVFYSAHWDRIERRLTDLREMPFAGDLRRAPRDWAVVDVVAFGMGKSRSAGVPACELWRRLAARGRNAHRDGA
jgi:hypothetical protein